jgi:hypothetical protein
MDKGVTPNIFITERAKLVKDHICSAALFARSTFEIERAYEEHASQDPLEQLKFEHTAYVIGSIFASDAYLEAVINTIFLDAIERKTQGKPCGVVAPLDYKIIHSMADAWKSGVDFDNLEIAGKFKNVLINKTGNKNRAVKNWRPTQDKYQCALIVTRKKPFGEQDDVWKSIGVLRRLRNSVVHYSPVGVESSIIKEHHFPESGKKSIEQSANILKLAHDLGEQLTNDVNDHDFIANPLAPETTQFPRMYLGWKCADWAVRSSLDFVTTFFKTMGLNPSKLDDSPNKDIPCNLETKKRWK